MYQTSKDYSRLYDLICEGIEIACYVDYDSEFRDICRCRKFAEYDILFSVRGCIYSQISEWHKNMGSEKDVFIQECDSLNVEWIKPTEADEDFLLAVRNTRNAFVNAVNIQDWNTELRTAAEDILIMYDQMREKLGYTWNEHDYRSIFLDEDN